MAFKKVIISKFGASDVLKLIEESHLPESETGEVRIKVLTGIISPDNLI